MLSNRCEWLAELLRHGLLRALLVQAAHAAARKQGTYPAAQYRRLPAGEGRAGRRWRWATLSS
jgi:hypothetical protein